MHSLGRGLVWTLVAGLGAFAYVILATRRQEPVSSAYILIAALCTYAIGYRFYSRWIATKALALDDRRATPCERHEDGREFVKTHRWIVFGHHFAAISGPGPLVGPVLAAQFGYLPGTLWILIGVVLGGAALVVSQFTLGADLRGNRPGFSYAAAPDLARGLYEKISERLASHGMAVQNGVFGADMDVALHNDGPVTIWMDTAEM